MVVGWLTNWRSYFGMPLVEVSMFMPFASAQPLISSKVVETNCPSWWAASCPSTLLQDLNQLAASHFVPLGKHQIDQFSLAHLS